MIHAGTMSIGSGWTFSVVGAYWISSISRLRNTTLPGRHRHVLADAGSFRADRRPAGLDAAPSPRASSASPGTRLSPPVSSVRRSTSGLVSRKLLGDTMSSSCRATNVTTSSWWRDTPRTPVVALYHHCCASRNDWWISVERPALPRRVAEAPVLRERLDAGLGASRRRAPGGTSASRCALRSAFCTSCACLAGDSARCDEPVGVREQQRRRRDRPRRAPEDRVQRAVEALEGDRSGVGVGHLLARQRQARGARARAAPRRCARRSAGARG